jgi:hypothetical protein
MKSGCNPSEKGPGFNRGLFLIAVFDDRLAARTVIMFLLDHGSTLGRLTLFNHSCTVTIPIAVVITMALADGYASADRAYANTDTNFFRQGGRSEGGYCSNYQCVFHRYLLFLVRAEEKSEAVPEVPKSSQIVAGTFRSRAFSCSVAGRRYTVTPSPFLPRGWLRDRIKTVGSRIETFNKPLREKT